MKHWAGFISETYPGDCDVRKLLFGPGTPNVGMIPCHPTLFKVLWGSFEFRAFPQSDFEKKSMLVQCHNMVGILDVVSKRKVVKFVFARRQGAWSLSGQLHA